MRALTLLLLLAAAPALAAEAHRVDVDNAGFHDSASGDPLTRVGVGTTVSWVVTGGRHTLDAYLADFGTGTMAQGETYAFTFDAAGAFPYRCTLHANMQGVVVVT